MFYLILVLFIAGFVAISLERRLSFDKTAVALLTGALIWLCVAFGNDAPHQELAKHLGGISELLFFLLGTMAIVEIIDIYGGFSMLKKVIKTAQKVKFLWILSFLTFFMSAVLGNLSATIVMITLMWKFIGGNTTRCFFASMIVIAANAGGAWSPMGDVTTAMLWMGGQVSTWNIILQLLVPSLMCMLVPLIIISLGMKGEVVPPSHADYARSSIPTTDRERWTVLASGIGGLMLVPVIKSVTHLPPYIVVLLMLAILWMITKFLFRKEKELATRLTLSGIFRKIDTSTVFFLLGILLAVAGLESAGHLNLLGAFLGEKVQNMYVINLVIGALSSVVDNVPLLAGTVGMFDVVSPDALATIPDPAKVAFMKHFIVDGSFWNLLAYSAGTGGSILIFGSASGIVAMSLAKIDWMWYVKKISWLALAGFLSGFAVYYLIVR